MQESAGQIPLVAYNYALKLDSSKRFEDAVEVAESGYQACVDFCSYQLLPGFLHIMAECHHFLGEDDKSKQLYIKAYCFYQILGNERDLIALRDEAISGANLGCLNIFVAVARTIIVHGLYRLFRGFRLHCSEVRIIRCATSVRLIAHRGRQEAQAQREGQQYGYYFFHDGTTLSLC